jgi:pilus assembly protein FimV
VASAPAAAPEGEGGAGLLDNPLLLAGGIGVLALLGGWGAYRYRQRKSRDNGETSFLESRLQPDSFFGASGGQRIDTRDASGASSSMSYSLSQLDAIGDVDPVAEADVYLAYGRDLQAEEILKEAMRSNPDRLAIRTKLLEVYAKRRDTKGFELLATQLYSLTQGQGEDWTRAQELGRGIDPDNPLYQPGGQPASVVQQGDQIVEPLGASTMPQSVMPASNFAPSMPPETQPGDLDLNLDAPVGDPYAAPEAPSFAPEPVPAPIAAPAPLPTPDVSLDFDLGSEPPLAPAPAPAEPEPMGFDLGALSLDLDTPPAAAPVPPPQQFPDLALGGEPPAAAHDDPSDPLVRKLELAEEFRQIGDTEGARDLLEEVVAKADGALKAKAQGMLNALA